MSKTLRFQVRYLAKCTGATVLVMAIFIPYSMMINTSGFRALSYSLMLAFLVPSLALAYCMVNSAILQQLALGFGATRRGWFWGCIATKYVWAIGMALVGAFVAAPVAVWFFGGEPIFLAAFLPLYLAASAFGAAMGSFLGLLVPRFSTAWMLLTLFSLLALLIGGLGFCFLWMDSAAVWGFITGAGLPVLLAALCVVFEAAGWLLLRKMMVKG